MISVYSVINSILWLSIMLALVLFFSRRTAFLAAYGVNALTAAAVLALLRPLLPLDLKAAYVIDSYRVFPWIIALLQRPVTGGLTLGGAAGLLWLSGTMFLLLRQGAALHADSRRRRRYPLIAVPQVRRVAEAMGLPEERVRVSREVSVPMVAGFFRPVIYLPPLDISDSELAWILRHERQHIRNGDNWLKLFYMLLRAALWWNPLVHRFCRRLEDILELRCDQSLLDRRSDAQRVAYTEALLCVARQTAEAPGLSRCPENLTALLVPRKEAVLLMRARLVLFSGSRGFFARVLPVALSAAVFASSYFVILQPAYPAPVEEGEIVVTINRENAYLVKRDDGKYELWFNENHVQTCSDKDIGSYPLCELEIRGRS